MSRVFASCTVSPFREQRTQSAQGSPTSSGIAIHGPIGQKPSMPLAKEVCGGAMSNWNSRALTSSSTV